MGSHRQGRYGYARTGLTLEHLEPRELMAVDTASAWTTQTSTTGTISTTPIPVLSALQNPRSITGAGNNLANLLWGSVGQQLERVAGDDYADGRSAPAGEDRPTPREISNALVDQGRGNRTE